MKIWAKRVREIRVRPRCQARQGRLSQAFAKEGKELRRRVGGYVHAKQLRRSRKVLKRQRTVLGIVMRELQRKSEGPDFARDHSKPMGDGR